MSETPPTAQRRLPDGSVQIGPALIYGYHAQTPRFVVTGPPDADATLCVAQVARFVTAPWWGSGRQGEPWELVRDIVRLVSDADLGRWHDLTSEGHAGAIILAWHARQRARGPFPRLSTIGGFGGADERARDRADQAARWKQAVTDWAELLALPTDHVELQGAVVREGARIAAAREARVTRACSLCGAWIQTSAAWAYAVHCDGCGHDISLRAVALIESPVMGADVWYGEHPSLRGYVAWQAESQRISISLRPSTARVRYSDEGSPYSQTAGLLVLDELIADGWGGRPEIIGSPRGVAMTREQAVDLARMIAQRIGELAA